MSSTVIDINDMLLRRRITREDAEEIEARWIDAWEAGRHTRNLARKMVSDIVEARWHRRRGDTFMMRRLLREAMEARSAYHHMLRVWGAAPGFMAGFRRERGRYAPYSDGAA